MNLLHEDIDYEGLRSSYEHNLKAITKRVRGSSSTWIWLGLSATALLIVAPYLAGIVGGVMGLSGAAATSAGLAFLGGGSLAAGGFGMAGGYTVLMTGGAILGYVAGNKQHQSGMQSISSEELTIHCAKLATYIDSGNPSKNAPLVVSACKSARALQMEFEDKADHHFHNGKEKRVRSLERKPRPCCHSGSKFASNTTTQLGLAFSFARAHPEKYAPVFGTNFA